MEDKVDFMETHMLNLAVHQVDREDILVIKVAMTTLGMTGVTMTEDIDLLHHLKHIPLENSIRLVVILGGNSILLAAVHPLKCVVRHKTVPHETIIMTDVVPRHHKIEVHHLRIGEDIHRNKYPANLVHRCKLLISQDNLIHALEDPLPTTTLR
jgi:hypothetical protein